MERRWRRRDAQKLISMNEPGLIRVEKFPMFGTSRGGAKFGQVLFNTT